jgi:uncharacterized membrane protein YdjX (TVP38/TMEM64 family)
MTVTTSLEHDAAGKDRSGLIKRFAPVAVLAAGFAAFFVFGLDQYLSLDALRAHRSELQAFVADHAVLAVLVFVAVYTASTALSFPGATALTVAGGFLFGALAGTVYVVAAATLGATIVFIVARSAVGDSLRRRAGPWLGRMEEGFRENAFNYLLVLRLVPLFPFFVVNLVPAFLDVRLRTYVVATLVGIIPGSFVFISVGSGLGSVLDMPGELSLGNALTADVVAALLGLSALSLLPVAYRRIKSRIDATR